MPSSSLNPLLNSLLFYTHTNAKFKDLQATITKSTSCIVLLPKSDILEWQIDRESLLPYRDLCLQDDFVASHLIPSPNIARSQHRARFFTCANSKTVTIKDNVVLTTKGFKLSIRAEIISEYIYTPASPYLPLECQLIIFEIDRPLIGTPALSSELRPTISSKYEVSLTTIDGSPRKAATKTDWSTRDFEKIMSSYPPLNRHVFGLIIRLIEQFDCSMCVTEDDLMKSLDDVVAAAIAALQASDNAVVSAMAADYNLNGEDIVQMIYQYVELNVSNKIWKQLILIRKNEDQKTRQAIAQLENVDISQIGMVDLDQHQLFALECLVWKGVEDIQKLKAARGSEAKTEILMNLMQTLGSGQSGIETYQSKLQRRSIGEKSRLGTEKEPSAVADGMNGVTESNSAAAIAASVDTVVESASEDTLTSTTGDKHSTRHGTIMSADILLSLMVLVILRSKLDYIDSELYYIQNFSQLETHSGSIGYAVMTLEAVLYHIKDEQSRLKVFSQKNKEIWATVTEHDDDTELVAYIEKLQSELTEDEAGTVIRSRSNSGESLLMLSVQNRNLAALTTLLDMELFSMDYITGDVTALGKTLLMAAVQTESQDIITEVLGLILVLEEDEQRQYFALCDIWKRTVAHYFFNAPWLIPKISSLVDWQARDQNGQTPLFAISRCYDHPNYDKLLRAGLDAWKKNLDSSGQQADFLDHMDNRGNTLLHVVKTGESLTSLLQYGSDINWPNDKGLTPIMTYCKFARIDPIKIIGSHPALDIQRTENRGFRCMEVAREPEVFATLDDICLSKAKPIIAGKTVVITRTIILNNELNFVISSSIVNQQNVTDRFQVHRTYYDFVFLQKWLAYENYMSYIPTIGDTISPFSVPSRPARQMVRELELRLTLLLRYLIQHPVFGNHELLWEFLMLPEFSHDVSMVRSRRKMESFKDALYSQETGYTETSLETTKTFLTYARQQTENMTVALERVARVSVHIKNKQIDYCQAQGVFHSKVYDVEFMRPWVDAVAPEASLSYGLYDEYQTRFSVSWISLHRLSTAVLSALDSPICMIEQLKEEESALSKHVGELSKGNAKGGWPMGLFAEKYQRSMNQLKEKIASMNNEIHRISSDINQAHITLASELGSFNELRENEVRSLIADYTIQMKLRSQEKLGRLERVLKKFRDMPQ